jgi:hypothetical protein
VQVYDGMRLDTREFEKSYNFCLNEERSIRGVMIARGNSRRRFEMIIVLSACCGFSVDRLSAAYQGYLGRYST